MRFLSFVKLLRVDSLISNQSALLVFVLSLFVFLPFSRFGVDLHHDGIVFVSALLVRHGFRVHSEVYNHYGPILNWIQAVELLIFGDRLIVLRVSSSIALAASAAITYIYSRRFFGKIVAIGAVIAWVACTSFLNVDMQMFPWSSDYLLLGNSIALLLASSIYVKSTKIQIRTMGIGFILGINCFIKIHPSLLILLAVICGAIMFVGVRQTWKLIQGVIASFFIVFLLLFFFGSVSDWWLQTISMTSRTYTGTSQFLQGFKANVLVNGVPGLFSMVLCLWFAKSIFKFKITRNISSLGILLLRVTSITFLFWIFMIDKSFTTLNPTLFLWSVVLGSLIYAAAWIERIKVVDIAKKFPLVVLLAVSIGSLFQLFPMVDRRHLWWSTLPALVLLLNEIQRKQRIEVSKIFVLILSISLLFPALLNAKATLGNNFVKIESSEPLNGMLVSNDFNVAYGGYMDLISHYQDSLGPRPVLSFCGDTLFTSLGKTLSQPDAYFGYWLLPENVYDWQIRLSFIQNLRPLIWVCWPYVDYEIPLSSFGYRIVNRPKCLNEIDRFNTFGLHGFLAVPDEWPMNPREIGLETQSVCGDS